MFQKESFLIDIHFELRKMKNIPSYLILLQFVFPDLPLPLQKRGLKVDVVQNGEDLEGSYLQN